jgi:hypothetical protein
MRIVLDIERLVLEGWTMAPAEARRVRAETEGELSRLLRTAPVPGRLSKGGAVPGLSGPAIQLVPGGSSEAMGTRIARSVYNSLGGGE